MQLNQIFLLVISIITIYGCEKSSDVSIFTYGGDPISTQEMDQFINQTLDSLDIPGLSFAIINAGKVVYHNALGVGNISTGEKIDDYSIFEAASLSKPIFAYYSMKMAEQSVIDLGRPLYFYLPQPEMEKDQRY